jgi:hypothetical protein
MARHKIQERTKRRLIAAGAVAVALVGTAVVVGITGSASAKDAAAANQECLPDVTNPSSTPPSPTTPVQPSDTTAPAPPPANAPGEQGPVPADQPAPAAKADTVTTFTAPDCVDPLGPFPQDFINIRNVQRGAGDLRIGRDGSSGSFVSRCGTNLNNHNNPANFIVAPGNNNGAHHLHDYVGNLSTDGNSTNESLAAAGTTCRNGDKSTYYWPVIRVRDTRLPGSGHSRHGGVGSSTPDPTNPHNVGTVLKPDSVTLQWRGSPTAKVVAMPEFIRIITGDAKAAINGGAAANAKWSCTGFTNRFTTKYPLCPRGSELMRQLDFPSCWDGTNIDSTNHRTHVVFPDKTGACPSATKAIPALRMTLTYDVPRGKVFAVDAFPEVQHNPITDHGDFTNVFPDQLMNQLVNCINTGKRC